jgi:hypothetical protein
MVLSEYELGLYAKGNFTALAQLRPTLYFVRLNVNGEDSPPALFEFDGLMSASRREPFALCCAQRGIMNAECSEQLQAQVRGGQHLDEKANLGAKTSPFSSISY